MIRELIIKICLNSLYNNSGYYLLVKEYNNMIEEKEKPEWLLIKY